MSKIPQKVQSVDGSFSGSTLIHVTPVIFHDQHGHKVAHNPETLENLDSKKRSEFHVKLAFSKIISS